MKTILMTLAVMLSVVAFAQKKSQKSTEVKIPLTAARWEGKEGTVEFKDHKGLPSLRLLSSGDKVLLKDFTFTNGTIMFDIEPEDPNFAGIYFRRKDDNESEYFYLRVDGGTDPGAMWAVQYAPIVKSVNLWDILEYYQGPGSFKRGEWNHVKLVVSGMQMLVYINDMTRPCMEVPRLEGNTTHGGIGFLGKAIIANLVVKPEETEGLSPREGFDPTNRDPRYLRHWKIAQPIAFPYGKEITNAELPTATTTWENLNAERRGLVNITRLYGRGDGRRLVWMKTKLNVDVAQTRKVEMGFSDEVWVLINGQLLYMDKNYYGAPIRKEPEGRCTLENTHFNLPLKAGENEIMIAVANDFYGWAIMARLDAISGITVIKD